MTHHHHHNGHCDICCAHGEHHASCHECACGHHHHPHEHHEDFAHELLEMADQAWMEVLKEKIKEQIKSTNGPHLDQLAKLVAESNHVRWQHKMGVLKDVQSYKEKLSAFFHKE
ncbi:MAG: hypothetical protein LLG04_02685 [Parachlamydia sp.]|nr:hypothetical protein [Parachlamydia sp.]